LLRHSEPRRAIGEWLPSATRYLALTLPSLSFMGAIRMAGLAGSVGVIYAQAILGAMVGLVAAIRGWHFVRTITADPPRLDFRTRRGWRNINRYRRR